MNFYVKRHPQCLLFPKQILSMKVVESTIPEELNSQPMIVIGTKGDRDRFVDWAKISIGILNKVNLVGVDLPKMVISLVEPCISFHLVFYSLIFSSFSYLGFCMPFAGISGLYRTRYIHDMNTCNLQIFDIHSLTYSQ